MVHAIPPPETVDTRYLSSVMEMKSLPLEKSDAVAFGMIALFTIIRLAVAPAFGLGVDEAHYFLYAKYLDLSYVDHPPLVGWAHLPLYRLFGTNELLVRIPPIFLFALVSFLCYRFITAVAGSKSIAVLAVAALNGSFILNAMSLMLLPDCFLLALIFPLVSVIKKIEDTGHWKYFVFLGIILGTAGLAKYTAILFVLPLCIYYILKKRYSLLFSGRMVMAAVIALTMVSPVLYWNLQHDFVSFSYQTGRVLGPSKPSIGSFFTSLLAQFGAYSPFLFIIAFYGFFRSFKAKNDDIRLSLLFGATILIFFLYSSLFEQTLPHWPSLFYLLFIPIGVHFLMADGSRRKRIFLYFSIAFSLTVTLFLYAELQAKWFSFPDYQSPFREIYGLPSIAGDANAILRENSNSKKAVAVTNWTMGSRMIYYSLPYRQDVFVIDRRKDQFDFWEKESPTGYDLLFINTHFHQEDVARSFKCQSTEPVKTKDILLNGTKVDTVEYVWCRNFQGFKE